MQTRNAERQMMDGKPEEVRISVRNLVEFVLREGDIDNRHQGGAENAMQEGSRIHRMIQKRMGTEYRAEVSLKLSIPTDHYLLTVEGRADGVIDDSDGVTIDEIKGTYRDLAHMREPIAVHVAQAKCYAYIYALQQNLASIRVRMTYCNMDTEDIRYFVQDYDFETLSSWFGHLIGEYRKWADYSWKWRKERTQSIQQLEFPYAYREGQKELASAVYRTIYHKRKLFIEAPTGVGKTLSCVFPAVKAIGQGMGEKLFYLTAKTITRTVAEETMELLRSGGLRFKSVILTAKEKICFLDKPECNPESCPYAKGHFDRVNEAMYALLTQEESFTREKIEEYAIRYQVCPFEFCLDMSLFADGIICDYNYLFDPHVYLKRFFAEGGGDEYLFLIDEAHNLLERGREMYSAVLQKEDFQELRRKIKQTLVSEMAESVERSSISGQLTLEVMDLSSQVSEKTESDFAGEEVSTEEPDPQPLGKRRYGRSLFVRRGYAEKMVSQLEKCNRELLTLKRRCEGCCVLESVESFTKVLTRLHATFSDYLEEQEEVSLDVRDDLLDFYFEMSHYLTIYEGLDEHYVKYAQTLENGEFFIKLFCVDPSVNLKECMARGRSTVLFSATFLPIQYYKSLLGGEEKDYEVYAKSVFNPQKRALFIADDVTSKYTRRSEQEFDRIACYIREIVKNRHGNYMVFCPSYAFLQTIYDRYTQKYATDEEECILQQEFMSESDREEFLDRFRRNDKAELTAGISMEIEWEEETLIGFCVLGGIFGEGIDLKNDSLIGAIIVGTGLPQVCGERELLKEYFDRDGGNGFDYAYRYPGMNKVLQAAGRVIRTASDVGIVALLDERFLQTTNRRLFPREWESFEKVDLASVSGRVERFWNEWL